MTLGAYDEAAPQVPVCQDHMPHKIDAVATFVGATAADDAAIVNNGITAVHDMTVEVGGYDDFTSEWNAKRSLVKPLVLDRRRNKQQLQARPVCEIMTEMFPKPSRLRVRSHPEIPSFREAIWYEHYCLPTTGLSLD